MVEHRHTWQFAQLLTDQDVDGVVLYAGNYHCVGCDRWEAVPLSAEQAAALSTPEGYLLADVLAPLESDSWAMSVAARLPGDTLDNCPPPRILGSARRE